MTTIGGQWDPEGSLGIGQVFSGITCVGYAQSKNRRCQNAISAANRATATELLDQMSKMDISSPQISDHLKPLERLLLCRLSQHQDQILNVVENWGEQIERMQVQRAANRQLVAKWEEEFENDPKKIQRCIGRLEEAARCSDIIEFQESISLLNAFQQWQIHTQAQLAALTASYGELNAEMETLHAQLAASGEDPARTSVAIPSLATASSSQRPSTADTDASSTEEIPLLPSKQSVNEDIHQGTDRRCVDCSRRIRGESKEQSKISAGASLELYSQTVGEGRSQRIPDWVSQSPISQVTSLTGV